VRQLLALLLALSLNLLPVQAAERIVSLAPFLTDMALQLGAGARLVGVLDDGQLPAELSDRQTVGSYQTLSAERIVSVQPDLILAWTSGNPPDLLERLRGWGIRVEQFDPQRLDDIASMTLQLGELLDQPAEAQALEADFRAQLDRLRAPPSSTRPKVFLQLWDNPLYTAAGDQLLSDALSLCGADNVFADLAGLAPQVGREGVLAANPDIIIALADQGVTAEACLDDWRRFPKLAAVKHNRLHVLDSDLLVRPTPAIIVGVEQLCGLVRF